MNLLYKETSPYLQQHANNPVHWRAWNQESLQYAKEENKLIIVSIGYSACHWCHVMERETFENVGAAEVMNSNFVCIKVDREEQPEVDAVYMKAVHLMSGRGGWPLNVVTLPDGRPIWGGTYVRCEDWIEILNKLKELYTTEPKKIIDFASNLENGIVSISKYYSGLEKKPVQQNQLRVFVDQWKESFDHVYGGTNSAPKFMMPNNYKFLLRYAHQNNDLVLLSFVYLSLDKMAMGGVFDVVGGGFSRYSTDIKWHIPHFEKMLYDNAQLVSLYSEAYRLSKKPLYLEIIEKTLLFVERELSNKEGGFYCALDADSLVGSGEKENNHNIKEEGAYYVWTEEELENLLGADYNLFAEVFNCNEFGLWEHNNYVLIQTQDLESIAKLRNIDLEELKTKKRNWEQILYKAREGRSKPSLDDKCLTSWNALMLSGYVDAYKATGKNEFFITALKIEEFIMEELFVDGQLFHNYKNNTATIDGFLEDYAFVISAFIDLYQVTFNEEKLLNAKKLTDYCISNFYNEQEGFFAFTTKTSNKIISEHYEIDDNVIPSSNSAMAKNLQELSKYFGDSHYENICLDMLQKVIPNIKYPSSYSAWMDVAMDLSESQRELIICSDENEEYLKVLNQHYLPNILIAGCSETTVLEINKGKHTDKKPLFYMCRNKTCQEPTGSFVEIKEAIGC